MSQQAALPKGELYAVDAVRPRAELSEYVQPLLVSTKHGVQGRPDRLMRTEAGWVPVDAKKRLVARNGRPMHSHEAQLLVYCLLVEDHFQQAVPYGVIEYANGPVRVPFTERARRDILQTIQVVQQWKDSGAIPNRNHGQVGKCQRCSFRTSCRQSLG